jgi:hypothetical protein
MQLILLWTSTPTFQGFDLGSIEGMPRMGCMVIRDLHGNISIAGICN